MSECKECNKEARRLAWDPLIRDLKECHGTFFLMIMATLYLALILKKYNII